MDVCKVRANHVLTSLFSCISLSSMSHQFVQFKRSVSAFVCLFLLHFAPFASFFSYHSSQFRSPHYSNHLFFFSSSLTHRSLASLITQSTAALYSHKFGQLGSMCFFFLLHFVPHIKRRTSFVFIHLCQNCVYGLKRYVVVAFKRLYASQLNKKNSVHTHKYTSKSWPVCLACFQISNNVPHFFSLWLYVRNFFTQIHVSPLCFVAATVFIVAVMLFCFSVRVSFEHC